MGRVLQSTVLKLTVTHPSIEGGLLFTLVTGFGWPVSLVVGTTPLAFASDKSSRELAELAACWLPVLRNILFTSLANCARFTFTEKNVVNLYQE